jgi:uncharacterized protein (TIGR02145 family)
MRKYVVIITLYSFLCSNSKAQTYSYCTGDTVYLVLNSFNGSVQWQQSNDSITWFNIAGATNPLHSIIFSGDKYYRAMINNLNCYPIYSTLQKADYSAQGCYALGSVFCSGPAEIIEVTNPITGKTWMDRNLGASQVATSMTDSSAFGDLYQWGRKSDGHQCRDSPTTTTLSITDQPVDGNFIFSPNTPNDWRNPQNINLWQGVNGVNNPCPLGYRLPTEAEWNAEDASFISQNATGAFSSPLKLPAAGFRSAYNGLFGGIGSSACYWSSTLPTPNMDTSGSRSLFCNVNGVVMQVVRRASGLSVRCIKN